MSSTCPACGYRADALGPDGVFLMFLDHAVEPLVALFQGELDVSHCDACNTVLAVTCTVVIVRPEQRDALMLVGTRMRGREAELIASIEATGLTGIKCLEVDSFAALREEVAVTIKERVARLNPTLLALHEKKMATHMPDHWRDLSVPVFSAMAVATRAAVPGLGFTWASNDVPEAPTVAALQQQIGQVQATTWLALANSWLRSDAHAASLEDDLVDYVDEAPMFPGTLERIFEICDRLQDASDKMGTHYMLGALRASVCKAAETANPASDQWAEIFLAFELTALEQGDRFPAHWRAMMISDERAAATVAYQDAWDAAGRRLQKMFDLQGEERTRRLEWLSTVLTRAGHPEILGDIASRGTALRSEGDVPLEAFEQMLRTTAAKVTEPGAFFPALNPTASYLLQRDRLTDVVRLADLGVELYANTLEARASGDAWLGRHLKEQRRPDLFLERVGEQPRDWENTLPLNVRAPLWTERANALRQAGRSAGALAIYESLEQDLSDSSDQDARQVNRLNLGILQRETGALDASLKTLRALLDVVPVMSDLRISALSSLATTTVMLGNYEDALARYDEALTLATGPYAACAAELRINRENLAQALARAQRGELPEWQQLTPERDGQKIVGAASAWTTAINKGRATLDDERADELLQLVARAGVVARERRDAQVALGAARAAGLLLEALERVEEALEHWLKLLDLCEEFAAPADPSALVRVARGCYLMDNPDNARILLQQVPNALAAALGNIDDLATAAESASTLGHALEELADVVLFNEEADAGWPDVRLVAELSRSAVARARVQRRSQGDEERVITVKYGLGDQVLAALAPQRGTLCVVEWIAASDAVGGFITRIDDQGNVKSEWLQMPEEIELDELAQRVRRRLANWLPDDEGDPFYFPDWIALENELVAQLSAQLDDDAHIVIIEHQQYAGLPWHVALRNWSCSYSSGWDRMLRDGATDPPRGAASLGVAMVPRAHESAAVTGALEASLQRIQEQAALHQLPLREEIRAACDRRAFIEMLQHVDLAKLLCHGFVGADGEIALMLAHDGTLPLANSVAAASIVGNAHRVSWRDLQQLPAAPRVIFSAACSSGTSVLVGLGERLGLIGALAPAGTAAVVAPWWDVVASAVIPVLDDALAAYLAGVPLTRAVHEASRRAEETQPRWLAWALTLEGDYR